MKSNSFALTRKRLLIAVISITFLFCVLCGRLCYLQVFTGDGLREKAAEQWYRDLPLKAKRGAVYDREGQVIVDSKDVFTVYVRPAAVKDKSLVAKVLAEQLEVNEEKLFEKISKAAVSEITVKKNVDFSTGGKLRDMGLDGVYFSVDSARNYPYDGCLTQVLGYTNADNEGQNGLEGYYDKYLRGVNGFSATETDNKGTELDRNVTKYVPAIPGADLHTTLDISIQGFAETAVRGAVVEWKAKSASMIVMDVDTGGIVAMAKTPTYDLSDIPRDDVNMLNAYSKNTMIVDVYEPGSTFKIFTTAAAIESGAVSDRDTFFCPGYRVVDGKRIKCWRSIGHGSQHLAEGVKNSCNCVFMDLALRMGTGKFYDNLRKFGFGSKTGVDFYSESSGLMMNEKSVKTVDLARIGFGQAVAVTPIQLISGVSAVVNGGMYHAPHFVSTITDQNGKTLYEHSDEERRVISQATSEKMRGLLENVVKEGSGKKAGVAGYRIGGKTGTAQKYENGAIAQGKYVSSFVGFAPVENPKYAVLMIIDEPGTYAYYGSIVAAPYVGNVFSKIFESKGIKPTEKIDDKELINVPYLCGKSVNTAINELETLGIKYEISGEGETVSVTLPSAGEQVAKGDYILLGLE